MICGLLLSACNVPVRSEGTPSTPIVSEETPVSGEGPAASPTPATPGSASVSRQVSIYLIGIEDAGASGNPVGCGDSAIPVTVSIPANAEPVQAALEQLFAIREQFYGQSGLYNALYQSNLAFESLTIDAQGAATLALSGALLSGGVCDDPRIQAQIEETVRQFPQVQSVSVLLNGKPLADLLSGKGEPVAQPPVTAAQIFLIALEDNGQSGALVGCGDSAVPVEVQIPASDDPAEIISQALVALFAAGDQYSSAAGLYNVLQQSDLQVENVTIQDGVVTVSLSGNLVLGGVCDAPRVRAQLEGTAAQLAETTSVAVFVNGKTLDEVLSQK